MQPVIINTQNLTKSSIIIFIFSFILASLFINNSFAQQDTIKHHHQMSDSIMIRQHMIHKRSSLVMPFNMDKVAHSFEKTNYGGIIKIKAKDLTDTAQIAMIRSHLKKEYELFSNADFRDPKILHGMNMPGIDVLEKSNGKFKVEYEDLIPGARITFTSSDSSVIDAIHKWFDAQLRDHGSDAKNHD